MSATRLARGGRIARGEELRFHWNGRELRGFRGDTLASALLANDVFLLGRSFKYHRPRGVMSAGVEESGALVTVGEGARRDPNVKATAQELHAGLRASGQNAWPGLRFDIGALSGMCARFLPAGFYYKTFMGPRRVGGTRVWMQFEKLIRRAAGMGAASRLPDPDSYEHAHAHCDALVVGGGPAGLAAAAAAARAGMDVLLVEQDFALGGDLLHQPPAADEKLRALTAEVEAAGVRVMTRTTAFGLYDHGVVGLLERATDHLARPGAHQPRQRFWTVRAKRIILATGALERQFVFGDNDRPGVMSASAARAYLHRYGVRCGARIVVATNNDSAHQTAAELAQAGAEVTLLDAREEAHSAGGELSARMRDAGVRLCAAHAPLRAIGRARVRAVQTATVAPGNEWIPGERMRCDLLLVSGGWSPAIHLHSQRARPVWDDALACFLAGACDEPITVAGAAAGVWNSEDCERSGAAAGRAATNVPGNNAPPAHNDGGSAILPLYEIRARAKKTKAFIDPQHDVTADDIRLAHREGFVSSEHLKRYTTLGMATDGGKVGNVIGLALMAEALSKKIAEVGATAFRPPYTPVALGALRGRSVGERFRPLRRTPMHRWNLEHGATMTMAGLWHRPWYFARGGENLEQAYQREAATVRAAVGLCDVTSLGKIALQGPDTAEFLNRVYTNPFAKLPAGKARYGIMLRDDGLVLDDGTTWRLSDNEYFMTTTTAHAATVMAWLEELLQTRWPELKVHATSVSEQWAGCALAGPKSRETLAACMARAEAVSNDALPFMGVVETELRGGLRCRIARISFSGELAFEIYAPSDYACAMMDMLWEAAAPLGGCLYGLEALGALRIEKGHVTGAELDGRVSIDDAGLGRMASTRKAYIGSALRMRPELLREDRPQLVGIMPKNRRKTFNAGALLCEAGRGRDAGKHGGGHGDGWITAVTASPALGHWIGLGFIAGGADAWRGRRVVAADPLRRGDVAVEITSPHMFDPDGKRMHG